MRVVELAHTLEAGFLQFLERGPLEQELTGERSKKILTGQFQGLGIIAFEQVAQHVSQERAQIDCATARFQQTA